MVKKWRSFRDAKKFVQTLNLQSKTEWAHYVKTKKKPKKTLTKLIEDHTNTIRNHSKPQEIHEKTSGKPMEEDPKTAKSNKREKRLLLIFVCGTLYSKRMFVLLRTRDHHGRVNKFACLGNK